MISLDNISVVLNNAIASLLQEDGILFECDAYSQDGYDSRKLHEVCINHRLAIHIERHISPVIMCDNKIYVDIEFNKEGTNIKKLVGSINVVRPDIIIHNRKSGNDKHNILVIECKKKGATSRELEDDKENVLALMSDDKYKYIYGSQIIYSKNDVKCLIYYKHNNDILCKDFIIRATAIEGVV